MLRISLTRPAASNRMQPAAVTHEPSANRFS